MWQGKSGKTEQAENSSEGKTGGNQQGRHERGEPKNLATESNPQEPVPQPKCNPQAGKHKAQEPGVVVCKGVWW